MTLCVTTALAAAVPCWCLRGACSRSGERLWCRFLSPQMLLLPCVRRSACGELPRPDVSCPRLMVRASIWSVCCAHSFRLPFWCAPRVRSVVVHSRYLAARTPPLPLPFCALTLRGPLEGVLWGCLIWFAPLRVSCSSHLCCWPCVGWRGCAALVYPFPVRVWALFLP